MICCKEDDCRLFTGDYLHESGVHLQMLSMMVGTLAGWLMYFPALLNCVLMLQNAMGGSWTTSFTLHDLVFPMTWFLMCR